MAGEEVVKAGCPLLEALRSGRVGIVRDERGEVVDLLVEGRGLRGTTATSHGLSKTSESELHLFRILYSMTERRGTPKE
jgi:hypothetical protein